MIEAFGPPSSASSSSSSSAAAAAAAASAAAAAASSSSAAAVAASPMSLSELPFTSWHLALRRAPAAYQEQGRGAEALDASDSSLQFCVKGAGYDSEGVFSLVALCALNVVAFHPERFSVQLPLSEEDRPVRWSIVHHASVTEHLVAFLEQHMEGVRFLSHYRVPPLLCEEDDDELLYVMQRDCRHPACGGGAAAGWRASGGKGGGREAKDMDDEDEDADAVAADDDEDGYGSGSGSYKDGQGALLGVDLDNLMASVVGESEMDENYLASIFDKVDAMVRPLDERMRCFVGDRGHLDDTCVEYTAMGRAIMMAAGDLEEESVDGSDADAEGDGDDDHDSVAEARGKKRPEKYVRLDDEYRNVAIKVVDLGNACWTHKHFTDDIQTRQYRSPEVLLGCGYDTSADMWSLGCIVFELVTGELLFDPRAGKSWDREEDHLAMMIELMGEFPPKLVQQGKSSAEYFTKRGDLRHIHQLKAWGLRDVLRDKYKLSTQDADELAAFVNPMLAIDPDKRATALECLRHPWLADPRAGAKGAGAGGVGGGGEDL